MIVTTSKRSLLALILFSVVTAFISVLVAAGALGTGLIDYPTWCPDWENQGICQCTNGTFEYGGETWCIPDCDSIGYFMVNGEEIYRDFDDAFRAANCIGVPCIGEEVEDPMSEPWWGELMTNARDAWRDACCEEVEIGDDPVLMPIDGPGGWSCLELRNYYVRARECLRRELNCDEFQYLLTRFFSGPDADCEWLFAVNDGFEDCFDTYFGHFFSLCVPQHAIDGLRQYYCPDEDEDDQGEIDDPRQEEDPREDYEQPAGGLLNPCNGLLSGMPVLLDEGWKVETGVDAVIAVPGPDLQIQRLVSSNPFYQGAGLVGVNQSLSAFTYVHEQWDDAEEEPNGCTSMRWQVAVHNLISAREFDASERTTWCDQNDLLLPPDGAGIKYINDGPSTDYIVPGTAQIGGQTFAVWRLITPGVGEQRFYRKWHEGLEVPGASETPEGLHGLLAQETDAYGNRREYDYHLFGPEGEKQPRCREIRLYAAGGQNSVARVVFFWHVALDSDSLGRLTHFEVWRSVGINFEVMTDRVRYLYKAEGDSFPDAVGTDGDLIAVIREQRVDADESAQGGDPLLREWATLYRYHNPDLNEEETDDDNDGYVEQGSNHQLKLVIDPEAVEYFVEHGDYNMVNPSRVVSAVLGLMSAPDDGSLDLDGGGSIKLFDLASKIMPEYETNGDKRLLTQYASGPCGCSGASDSGWRKFEYQYFEFPGNAPFQTTQIDEYGQDSQGEFTVHRHTTYNDLIRPEGPEGAPYLMTKAVVEPGPGGRQWVTHYEYEQDSRLKIREYSPSACGSYTPVTPPQGEQGAIPPSYNGSGSSGLVMAYVYNDQNLLVEIYNESGTLDALISRTTYGDAQDDILKFLPVKIECFAIDSQSPPDDKLEVTEISYGFHESGTFKIAWVESEAEAELGSENGPGGTYSTVVLHDENGRPFWRRSADGSLTNKEFDDSTGGVSMSSTNADPVDLGTHPYPSAGANVAGWGRDSQGQRLPGGVLATEYDYDALGRVTRQTTPGGVSGFLVRDLAYLPAHHGRDNLTYYRTIALPHQWSQGGAREPAIVRWYTAGATLLEESSYEVQSGNYENNPAGVMLDGDPLSRTAYTTSLHGTRLSTRVWHDVSGNDYSETFYRYDEFGRPVMTIAPTGDVTVKEYDTMDRVIAISAGIVDQSGEPDESTYETLIETYIDGDGTATHGTGNGLVTLQREHVSDSEVRNTEFVYDGRERLQKVINPTPPHTLNVYDNLDRVIESGQFASEPPDDIEDFASLPDRLTYSRTYYSQRGLPYKSATALNPTHSNPEFLESHTWFDSVGRTVAALAPDSTTTKWVYDGHGRVIEQYVTDRGGDADPETAQSHADAFDLSGDVVFKEVQSSYGDEGYLDLVTVHRRSDHVSESDTGALTELGNADAFITTFVGYVYDEIGRQIRVVNFGTNLDTFEHGGTLSITWPPTGVPDWNTSGYEDYIVTAVEYNDHGELELEIDPLGRATKTVYDDLGRTIAVIDNYENATVSWYSGDSRWKIGNLDFQEPDTDRTTTFVYDTAGRVKRQVAHLPPESGTVDDVQITEFVYGVDPSQGSDLYSNALLYETRYPRESDGLPGTTDEYVVRNTYNRAGEQTSITDQNGTVHALTLDAAGRTVRDEVTNFGPYIDDDVEAIVYAYDALGRRILVESRDDTDTTLNAVEFDYDQSGVLTEIWQDRNGAVDRNGGASDSKRVEYQYLKESFDEGNRLRRVGVTYPSGAEVKYEFGDPGSVDDMIGRARALSIADEPSQNLVEYSYVGVSLPVVVDYPGPDVRLDRALAHNGTREESEYVGLDRFGRVAKHMWVGTNFAANDPATAYPAAPSLVELDYTYDAAGNRLSRIDGREGAKRADRDEEFTYDELNRLLAAHRGVRVDESTFTFSPMSETWLLDAIGNWAGYETDADSSGTFSHTETRSHNLANELTGQDFDGDEVDDAELTFDKVGNIRTRTVNSVTTMYTHDAWNRLVRVKIAGDDYGEYEYNGLHQRTVRRAMQEPPVGIPAFDRYRIYYYDADWRIVEEHINDDFTGSIDGWTEYFWGPRNLRGSDDLVRRRLNRDVTNDTSGITYESSYYHLTDPSRSTIAVVDEAGKIVERVLYDAYGRARHRWWNDVDGDGDYDSNDRQTILTLSLSATGSSIDGVDYHVDADLNQDGLIDFTDVTLATTNYTAARADERHRRSRSPFAARPLAAESALLAVFEIVSSRAMNLGESQKLPDFRLCDFGSVTS